MSNEPSSLPKQNPIIPEGINVSAHRPLRELTVLTLGAAGLFIALSIVVWSTLTFGARYIPFAWEARLGQSIAEVLEPAEPISDLQTQLQQRLDRIVQQMDDSNSITLTLHVVKGDVVNAFATLGGHVFVFEGLLTALKTDVGLDMVLAHEAAHVLNRDPIQAAAGALGVQLMIALVTGQGEIGQADGLMTLGSQLMLLSYSREQERAADERALNALAKLHDDLTGADELFVFIAQADEAKFPEFLSSHPEPQARALAIEQALKKYR